MNGADFLFLIVFVVSINVPKRGRVISYNSLCKIKTVLEKEGYLVTKFNYGEKVRGARIVVVGVGSAGNHVVNRMLDGDVQLVEFIGVNTDKQALQLCKAPVTIRIGEKITKGLSACAQPEIGQKSAEESIEMIQKALAGADMVFLTCGMGGGTGTGVTPVIAKVAKDINESTLRTDIFRTG